MVNILFWFALIGWVSGWVTGRAMKCQSHSPWVDSLVGMIGGLIAGYLVRGWEIENWGLLAAAFVATAGAVSVTWSAHRMKHFIWHSAHKAH